MVIEIIDLPIEPPKSHLSILGKRLVLSICKRLEIAIVNLSLTTPPISNACNYAGVTGNPDTMCGASAFICAHCRSYRLSKLKVFVRCRLKRFLAGYKVVHVLLAT